MTGVDVGHGRDGPHFEKRKAKCGTKVCYGYQEAKLIVTRMRLKGYATARLYICRKCRPWWVFHVTSGVMGFWR